MVMTVEEQLAAALAEVENLRTAIAEKDGMIRDLQNKLLWLRKKVFGRMSEKSLPCAISTTFPSVPPPMPRIPSP